MQNNNLIYPFGSMPVIGIEIGQLILPIQTDFKSYQINQNIPFGFKENQLYLHAYPSIESAIKNIKLIIDALKSQLPINSYIIVSKQGYVESHDELQHINDHEPAQLFSQEYYRNKKVIINSFRKKSTGIVEDHFLESLL
ncbi:MAG: hypothetical protein MR210_08760 [Erysipelotrichaceae bacterium]|nr:hypothetical protein [Erysipelotrichaceae bacterium]MDY5252809.1 hypothetical protein [Erysipelotrichaceae bacterium]